MLLKNCLYKEPNGKTHDYILYEIENKQDEKDFINLVKQTIEETKNRKISTKIWLERWIKLFGLYKSYPRIFSIMVANNFEHPFQFYSIILKKKYANLI